MRTFAFLCTHALICCACAALPPRRRWAIGSMNKYFVMRGKLVSRVAKYPGLQDYLVPAQPVCVCVCAVCAVREPGVPGGQVPGPQGPPGAVRGRLSDASVN
jgi:hypothetical protein